MKILIKTNVVDKKEWSGSAIASFICGVISLLILPILPAIILGHIALYNIKKHNMKGRVFASIGLVLGYIFFTYMALIIMFVCMNGTQKQYTSDYSKELRASQRQIAYTKSPSVPKVTYNHYPKFKPIKVQSNKNLYDKILNVEIAVNKENRGNFIYGVGTAGLKYLVNETGIDDKMPKKTLGSETLTKMIEDSGFTPKTNYSIAGRGGLIDYLWKTISY